MTPGAILRLLEGYRDREEAEYRRVAWQTAHLMNVSGKSTKTHITVDDLVGKRKDRPLPKSNVDPPTDDEKTAAGLSYIAMLNASLGGKDTR